MSRIVWLLCGFVVVAATPPAGSQPGDPNLPFAGPAPPAELAVLAPLVGVFEAKLEWRPSVQDKDGKTATGRATGQWSHNRHFVRMESTTTSAGGRGEATELYTYDARKRVYRRWLFTSLGQFTESEGQWDAARRTMTWKTLNLSPNVTGGATQVLTDDRSETRVQFQRDDGAVLIDATAVLTRKK